MVMSLMLSNEEILQQATNMFAVAVLAIGFIIGILITLFIRSRR